MSSGVSAEAVLRKSNASWNCATTSGRSSARIRELPAKALEEDNVGQIGHVEGEDVERVVECGVRPEFEGGDLKGHIGELGHLEQVRDLTLHDLRITDPAREGRLIDDRRELQAAVEDSLLTLHPRGDDLVGVRVALPEERTAQTANQRIGIGLGLQQAGKCARASAS